MSAIDAEFETDIPTLRRILAEAKTIAVVGLAAHWHRPSNFAAKYMPEHGYRGIPVNPAYQEVLGEKCYPSLHDIPEPIDIVDCFRASSEIPAIAADAIANAAKKSAPKGRTMKPTAKVERYAMSASESLTLG